MAKEGKASRKESGKESRKESCTVSVSPPTASPLSEEGELRPPKPKARKAHKRVRPAIELTEFETWRLREETNHCTRTIQRFKAGYVVESTTQARIERAMLKLGIAKREREVARRRVVEVQQRVA